MLTHMYLFIQAHTDATHATLAASYACVTFHT